LIIDEQISSLILSIKRTVPRMLASNVVTFLRDLLVVIFGWRCSVLVEYALPHFSDFIPLFKSWKSNNLDLLSSVVLYWVFDDVFIINVDLMKKRCKDELDPSSTVWKRHIFVDINVNLKQPELISESDELTSPLVHFASELLHKLECLKVDDCVVELIADKSTMWIPMLFGWILDYPAIYCNSFMLNKIKIDSKIKREGEKKKKGKAKGKEKWVSSVEQLGNENDNCLSFVPLHLYHWKVQTNARISIAHSTQPLITIKTQTNLDFPTTDTSKLEKSLGDEWVISSFSIPVEIEQQTNNNDTSEGSEMKNKISSTCHRVNSIVESWNNKVNTLKPIAGYLGVHTLERSQVTLPHVLL